MSSSFDPYTPVQSVLLEIQRRWSASGGAGTVPFHQLCDDSPEGRLQGFLKLNDCARPGDDPEAPHEVTLSVRWVKAMARAVACCLAAKKVSEKPLRELLLQALEHCHAADAIAAEMDQRVDDAHAARVKGGKARQAKLDPARLEAARLIKSKRPHKGWPTPAAAARAIVEDLKAFIRAERLSLVPGDNLVRTIVRWIHEVPVVTAAFSGRDS